MKRLIGYGLTGLACYYTAGYYYLEGIDKEMDLKLTKNINDPDYKEYLSYPLLRYFPLLLKKRRELITKENLTNSFIALINNEPIRKNYEDAYKYYDSSTKDILKYSGMAYLSFVNDIYYEMRRLISEENKYIFDYIIYEKYTDWDDLHKYINKHNMLIDNKKKATLYLNLVERIISSYDSKRIMAYSADDMYYTYPKYKVLLDKVREFKKEEVEKIEKKMIWTMNLYRGDTLKKSWNPEIKKHCENEFTEIRNIE
jgi:hypothetical protein